MGKYVEGNKPLLFIRILWFLILDWTNIKGPVVSTRTVVGSS